MSRIMNINNYEFSHTDRLLFDTNIWFYLVGTPSNPDNYAQIYTAALEQIIAQGSKVFIDILGLSEFINRYARYIAEQAFNIKRDNYKEFRLSKKFKPVAHTVAAAANRVMQIAERINTGFESIAIKDVLMEFSDRSCDFNDQILEKVCLRNELALVTNDADFKKAQCTVITANRDLLY